MIVEDLTLGNKNCVFLVSRFCCLPHYSYYHILIQFKAKVYLQKSAYFSRISLYYNIEIKLKLRREYNIRT